MATFDYFPDGTPKNEFDYNEPLDDGSYLFYYKDEDDENLDQNEE